MEADKSVMVGTYARTQVVLERGIGCKVYDLDGKEYLDMTAGIAVNSLGHADPDWLKALIDQASTLAHVSNVFYSVPQVGFNISLLEKLGIWEYLFGLDYSYFLSNGRNGLYVMDSKITDYT